MKSESISTFPNASNLQGNKKTGSAMLHTVLQLILIASLATYVTSCGKKRCHKLTGKNCQTNTPTPAPQRQQQEQSTGDVVHRMVGEDVTVDPYSSSGDNPVQHCNDLDCNFDSGCCWNNNEPPNDQLAWVRASGKGESQKLRKSFGTTTSPDGSYLLTASNVAGTSEQTAQFFSCPIICTNGDMNVKLKHWQSSGTHLEVCTLDDPNSPPSNCKNLPTTSGQEHSVTVPGGQNKRVVILAKGFTASTGTVAIIDDITVECQICPDTTTTTTQIVTQQTPSPQPPQLLPPCKEINCNFEQGNPCSYSTSTSSGTASKNWDVHEAPWQNPLTGIKKSVEGRKFVGSYLKKAGEKSVLETNANFDNPYVVRFDYYEAAEGIKMRACCDSESNCPLDSTPDVKVSDYKGWRKASILCPVGTRKVLFVSENERGTSEGAAAVDNIQLLESTGGSPDSESKLLCV